MITRIVVATSVLFVASPAISLAQMTPVSGSRGISMSATGGSSYSNSAQFEVQTFNDSHSVGGGGGSGNASIQSSLTSSLWSIVGSAYADAMFASPGTVVTANSSADLAFHVEAGTNLRVTYHSQGSYGGMNSRIRVLGAGLDIIATGGQNGQGGTQSVLVSEPSTVYLSAWGGGSSVPNFLPRYGNFSVTITATAPAPGALGLLATAALFAFRRRRETV